jgi:ABC-type transporter Mla subunit MlaD
MADQSLFDQLKSVLTDFKSFLDDNVPTIKPAIQAIASLVPQVVELLDELTGLLDKLKTEIQNLDVGAIPGLGEVASFTGMIPAFLDAAKKLLPDEASSIGAIGDIADVVTGLPSVDAVKDELVGLIDAVKAHLVSLKPA